MKMTKNGQSVFSFDARDFLDPNSDEYKEKLTTLDLLDYGQDPVIVEEKLIAASDAISSLFSWDESLEGYDFWVHACDALSVMAHEVSRRRNGGIDVAYSRDMLVWGSSSHWNLGEKDVDST